MRFHVIIVVGDSERFLSEGLLVLKYMNHLPNVRVSFIRTAYLDLGKFWRRFNKALRQAARSQVLLVWFSGHGNAAGWRLNDVNIAKYSQLALVLQEHSSPILVVNDCCHAMSLEPFLKQHNNLAGRTLLIGACTADKTAYQGLTRRVLASWSQQKEHCGGIVVSEVDVLVLPKLPVKTEITDFIRRKLSCFLHWLNPVTWDIVFEGTIRCTGSFQTKERRSELPEQKWGTPMEHHFFGER